MAPVSEGTPSPLKLINSPGQSRIADSGAITMGKKRARDENPAGAAVLEEGESAPKQPRADEKVGPSAPTPAATLDPSVVAAINDMKTEMTTLIGENVRAMTEVGPSLPILALTSRATKFRLLMMNWMFFCLILIFSNAH